MLIRSTSKLENLAGLPAETVTGDLLQADALRSAVSGCDAVMHVAADYRLWVTDLTFVPTWASVTYGCFLTDAYSRTIVGWRSPVTSAPAWSSTPERASWCRN